MNIEDKNKYKVVKTRRRILLVLESEWRWGRI